jgi:hypothetical protein
MAAGTSSVIELADCLAIDPGPEEEHGVVYVHDGNVKWGEGTKLDSWGIIRRYCESYPIYPVIIEGLSNYGQAIGDTTLRTAYTIGRLYELANNGKREVVVIRRTDVRYSIIGSAKGNDSIIKQSILERFGGPGAAKKGGPLHGIKGHNWSALALAVAYKEMLERGDVKAVRF